MENQKKLIIRLSALTHVGMERDHNEDNFVLCKDFSSPEWNSSAIAWDVVDQGEFAPGELGCCRWYGGIECRRSSFRYCGGSHPELFWQFE
jgi:hypothetical protein